MSRRRQQGYTLVEMVVAVGVFGIIVAIFAILTSEMRAHQQRLPQNFMRNPQMVSVISRLRRDVQDRYGGQYLDEHDGYKLGKQVLIMATLQDTGGLNQIVWDFRELGVAKRRSYNVGVATEWVARGLPPGSVEIGAVEFSERPYGVRLKVYDEEGRLAIDQILQPRTHD